jgi:membrane-bound inhibitor of C-type lysozyme
MPHEFVTPDRRFRRRAGAIAAFAFATGLPACAPTITETVLAPDNVYVCRDGKSMRVVRAADGRSAEVSVDDRRFVLLRTESAAQEKYGSGTTTLYLDGEKALLTADSFVVAGPCVSSVALPVQPSTRY